MIVEGNPHPEETQPEKVSVSLKNQVQQLIDDHQMKPNAAIKQVAKNNHLKKQDVYNEYHGLN